MYFFPHCIHFQLKSFNRLRFITSHLKNLQTTGNENLTKIRWHKQPTLKVCWALINDSGPLAKRECSDETLSLPENGFNYRILSSFDQSVATQVEWNSKDNKDSANSSWMFNALKVVSAFKITWPASKAMHGQEKWASQHLKKYFTWKQTNQP